MKVCKFGGSSLADAGQIGKVCDIVASDPERRIVVVSAPGKRNKQDAKVTDLLIACAEARLAGGTADAELARVVERFTVIQRELGLPDGVSAEIAASLADTVNGDASHRGRYLDAVKAAGEDNCAKLVAAEFERRGMRAAYCNPGEAGLLLSDEYGNAQILPESYARLAALRNTDGITVFPGFFGYTAAGDVVTFSRGGSDITGSILAAAVHADLYENFTDVDCVLAADPSIVADAGPITELTYREMRELAYAGFGVLHDEAIIPAVEARIPICVRNTNRPNGGGTMIVADHRGDASRVVGIAGSDGFATIYVSKYLMNREVGFGRRLLQIFESEGISYEHAPSGIDNMSIIVREQDLTAAREADVLQRIQDELQVNDVSVERGLALIMIVGEGMRFAVGLASRATGALAKAGISIEMINQGSSEISVMFGVRAEHRRQAVAALYDAFFRG
jgi:aspartate kinase